MLSLDKVIAGAKVRGLAGAVPVEVVRIEWIGDDALNVVYRSADGPAEVLLFRDAEPRLELIPGDPSLQLRRRWRGVPHRLRGPAYPARFPIVSCHRGGSGLHWATRWRCLS
jgi:hypothetical protein